MYTRPDGKRRCETRGCNEWFAPRTTGGSPQRYCSKQCWQRDYARKYRGTTRPYYTTTRYECPAGHERTPENTYWSASGTPSCRICRQKHSLNYQRRNREACRERSRQWRLKQKQL